MEENNELECLYQRANIINEFLPKKSYLTPLILKNGRKIQVLAVLLNGFVGVLELVLSHKDVLIIEWVRMDKTTANSLMKEMLALSQHIDEAGELTKQIIDENERYVIRKGIADVAGIVYTDIMMPLIRQYPELDPDKDKFEK